MNISLNDTKQFRNVASDKFARKDSLEEIFWALLIKVSNSSLFNIS